VLAFMLEEKSLAAQDEEAVEAALAESLDPERTANH
jgi:hypothetical protein